MSPRQIFRRPLWSVVTVVFAVMLAACGDSTGPEDSPAGTYLLKSVAGGSLPYVLIQVGADKLEVTAGRLTINSDATCSTSVTLRLTESGSTSTETESDVCTWTRNNNAMAFSFSDGTSESGSWSGSTITVTSEGVVFVFER